MFMTSRPSSGTSRSHRGGRVAAAVVLLGTGMIAVGFWHRALGDEIVVRGGGRIQGKMVDDTKQPGRVLVWLSRGRHPLSFDKSQIIEVIAQPSSLDDYVAKRSKAAGTADGQVELGVWCSQNKLEDLARSHFDTALQLDPGHQMAHVKLGHVLQNGVWRTRDEVIELQESAKLAGRAKAPEGKAKRESNAALSAAETSWLRRVRVMHQGLVSGPDDRRREAETQLMAIHEPEAVAALVRVFGTDERSRRLILALILGSIPGRESTTAMTRQILFDPESEVRAAFLDQLQKRDRTTVVPQLVRALGSSDLRLINRAAWALGNLDAMETVPKLINVLTSTQSEIVLDSANVGGSSFGMAADDYPPWALKAVTRNGVAAYQSPPVVAPGVIAYGATVAPFYGPTLGGYNGSDVNFGPQSAPIPEPRVATFTYQNVEVLSALQQLTRQDFGYDIDAWRRWVSRSFNPNQRPARRVNQP
jgi:hypothetical protein